MCVVLLGVSVFHVRFVVLFFVVFSGCVVSVLLFCALGVSCGVVCVDDRVVYVFCFCLFRVCVPCVVLYV